MADGTKKWAVFFTNPGNKKNDKLLPDEAFVKFADSSKKNLYCAFFEIDSFLIANSIIKAYERGVDVRVVTDSDYISNAAVKKIIKSGIRVVHDGRSAFMHNKFAVADGRYVWTGSFNATENGAKKNNNNALMFESESLYNIYAAEFSEMFDSSIFGNRKEELPFPFLTNKYYVEINDIKINVFFSPDDNVEKNILKRIRDAKKEIVVMAFSFTSDIIGNELINASERGVKIRVLFERRGAGTSYSEFSKLKAAGIDVKKDKNYYNMHHKVMIIDREWTITGSYNFSKNAAKYNDENIIIINSKDIAEKYLMEFTKLY